jgi:hypothetical protein
MLQDLLNLGAQFGVFFFSNQGCKHLTPKVGVHLGIIGLHFLHFPPFVKMCFAPKHTIGLIGPCTSHFVTNPMLKFRHQEAN